jgi:hypothetical protein
MSQLQTSGLNLILGCPYKNCRVISIFVKTSWKYAWTRNYYAGNGRGTYKCVGLLRIAHCRDSVDATGCGLDDQGVGVWVPIGSRIFSSPRRPGRLWGPLNLLSNGYGGGVSFLEVKRPGREADHSPPTSAEVKKMWSYTSTPPYTFIV